MFVLSLIIHVSGNVNKQHIIKQKHIKDVRLKNGTPTKQNKGGKDTEKVEERAQADNQGKKMLNGCSLVNY